MNVQEKIFEFVREHFDIGDDPDYTPDVHLFDEGFVDSLGAVEIIEFGIQITQKDITLYPMNTVEEIAAVVESKI